ATGLSDAAIANPTASPTVTTTYTLTETVTATNCSTTNNVTITVQPSIANNTISAAQTICATQTPASLTGSTPTGGTGTYTYLWESSTTSASAGFANASGTNNTINYSPAALTQTTWYRRMITSGQCSGAQRSESNVIEITVQPAIANNTVSAAQTICATQTPATLTGTMPTGGNGTYTYLWESSTTSAIAGFTAASGTNNTQNYSAAALTQTTWFRRTVTSGQ